MYEVTKEDNLSVIKLVLSHDGTKKVYYTISVTGIRTIYYKKQPIIFSNILDIPRAMEISTCGARFLSPPSPDDLFTINYIEIIESIKEGTFREYRLQYNNIIEGINFILDPFFDLLTKEQRKTFPNIDFMAKSALLFTNYWDFNKYHEIPESVFPKRNQIELSNCIEWALDLFLKSSLIL